MPYLKQRFLAVLIAAGATVGLDQWTKQLALEYLEGEPDIFYFGELFRLTFVRNEGAFLSLGADFGPVLRTILLEGFPALLLIALLIYIFRSAELDRWQTVALALIVGGGLSNIIDRLQYGHVVDMMHMKVGSLQTGIFNVADMGIMAGMFMMIPYVFRREQSAEEGTPEEDSDSTVRVEA